MAKLLLNETDSQVLIEIAKSKVPLSAYELQDKIGKKYFVTHKACKTLRDEGYIKGDSSQSSDKGGKKTLFSLTKLGLIKAIVLLPHHQASDVETILYVQSALSPVISISLEFRDTLAIEIEGVDPKNLILIWLETAIRSCSLTSEFSDDELISQLTNVVFCDITNYPEYEPLIVKYLNQLKKDSKINKKINEVILYDITYFFKTIEVYFSLFDEEKKKQLEHLGLSKISAKIDKILNSEI